MTIVTLVRGSAAVCEYLGEHKVAAPTPFQTSGWWRGWVREAAEIEAAEPLLVQAASRDGTMLLVGLQIQGDRGQTVLRPLSWPWADYHEAVGARGEGEVRTLAEAIDRVRHQLGAALALTDLIADGLLHRSAVALGAKTSTSATVVGLDLRDRGTLDWLTARGEIRRKRRRLERQGTLRLIRADTPEEIANRLPAFIALHAAQWSGRADVVAPFDGGSVDRTFAAVAAEASTGARLDELWLDEHLLAAYFGFAHCSTYWAYRTAYSQERRRDSPGHLLVAAMAAALVAEGIRTFDLMRGAYAYKLALPSHSASTVTAVLQAP